MRVDFAEIREPLTQNERLMNAQMRFELGAWSPVNLLLAENPDFGDRDAALAELLNRKAETEQITVIN